MNKKNDILKLFKLTLILSFLFLISKLKFIVFSNFKNKTQFFMEKKDNHSIYNNKQMINISLSLDNSLVYQTLVVMTSALENNDKDKHILCFYLLLSYDFNTQNIQIFESLKLKYQLLITLKVGKIYASFLLKFFFSFSFMNNFLSKTFY